MSSAHCRAYMQCFVGSNLLLDLNESQVLSGSPTNQLRLISNRGGPWQSQNPSPAPHLLNWSAIISVQSAGKWSNLKHCNFFLVAKLIVWSECRKYCSFGVGTFFSFLLPSYFFPVRIYQAQQPFLGAFNSLGEWAANLRHLYSNFFVPMPC